MGYSNYMMCISNGPGDFFLMTYNSECSPWHSLLKKIYLEDKVIVVHGIIWFVRPQG